MLADLLSAACVFAGGFFLLVGGIGLVRLPDLFTRLHAVGVGDTLGLGLFVLGFVIQAGFGSVSLKLLLVLAFLLLTGPVACHALAKAALHGGVRPLVGKPAGPEASEGPAGRRADPPWST